MDSRRKKESRLARVRRVCCDQRISQSVMLNEKFCKLDRQLWYVGGIKPDPTESAVKLLQVRQLCQFACCEYSFVMRQTHG